jgi:Ca2+-binding RTX toxin-like protein
VIETVYLNNQNMHWNNTAVNLILGSNSTETQIYGSDTADILLAYGSGNTISGGAGNDYIIGSRLASQDEVDLYNERNHFTDSSDPNFLTLDKVMAGTLNTVGDILNGGAGDDYIKGKSGNDIIDGGEGNDTLKGKGGNDTFVFDTALNSDKNIDLIEGFTSGSDKIELHQSIFTELTAGITLNASNLFSSADITSGNDFSGSSQILFNTNTGALYYDADGSGSAHAIQFATLGSGLHPAITSSDFIVVA